MHFDFEYKCHLSWMPLPGIIMRLFFAFNPPKVLRIHCTEWDSRLCETGRIYLCLHKCRVSWQLCLYFLPLTAGLTWKMHITPSKKATIEWRNLLFYSACFTSLKFKVFVCEPQSFVFSTHMDIQCPESRTHSLDSERDDVLLRPLCGLHVSNVSLYCDLTSTPGNLREQVHHV